MASARVVEIRRFPVKSMRGEELPEVRVEAQGLAGDRAHAVWDETTGKVASGKSPRLWSGLLAFRAKYVNEGAPGAALTVEGPDGTLLRNSDADFDERLSQLVGRPVRLASVAPPDASYDDEWPDIEGLAPDDLIENTRTATSPEGLAVSTLPVGLMAPGTFQDVAPITIMTTASLRAAASLAPASRWDPRRFRANFLIDIEGDGFVENDWVGRRLQIGEVVLEVTAPTPRCVMTTLAQEDLAQDRDVLRTVAKANRQDVAGTGLYACLGAYASVIEGGRVTRADAVEIG